MKLRLCGAVLTMTMCWSASLRAQLSAARPLPAADSSAPFSAGREYAERLEATGFSSRRSVYSAGRATFIGPDEIERRRPRRLSHLVQDALDIRVGYTPLETAAYAFGDHACVLNVFLDGVRVSLFDGSRSGGEPPGFDIVPVNTVLAVEIYPLAGDVPEPFAAFGGNCGALVIWTK